MIGPKYELLSNKTLGFMRMDMFLVIVGILGEFQH